MKGLRVELPSFCESAESLLREPLAKIENHINVAAAYQRYCNQMLRCPDLAPFAREKFSMTLDWACASMNYWHAYGQDLCGLYNVRLCVRHYHPLRQWILEVQPCKPTYT
jgi:hypothetical protein